MTIPNQRRVTLLAVIGLSYWFFGNLYEAIVFSPNWIINSLEQMRRLNAFFLKSSPTLYFVPLTQITTLLVWFLLWRNEVSSIQPALQRASIYALLATLLNAFIVSTIVLKLFAKDFEKYGELLTVLTWRWNVLNIFRMVLVALTIHHLFNAYRKLDKL